VHLSTSKRALSALIGSCILFFAAGRAFVPHLGVQTDEALFTAGIYQSSAAYYTVRLFHHDVPLMVQSYVGTLKSLIYAVLFHFFTPNPTSTRIPVLLTGILTVCLFFFLLRRISGTPAAVAGALLLATDSIFLLTTVFDWGPVALQHLLLVGGMLLLYRYYESRRLAFLTWGFFLFGLAMWDKALFAWSLSALAVACLIVFPRVLFRLFTWRSVAVAGVAFLAGASPLIRFNIARRGETFRSNMAGSHDSLANKFPMVLLTLRGEGLFGYLVREDNDGASPLPPGTRLARGAEWLSARFGHPRRNLMLPALGGALLLGPLLWRVRARAPRTLLFTAVFCLVAWLEMAANQGTGGSVHHVVLLWPFPQLIVAVAFGEAAQKFGRPGKAALVAMLIIVVSSNLLVTNEYYRMALRNGGGLSWSDAVTPLAGFLRGRYATQMLLIDWGMFDSLRLLDAGTLPLREGADPLAKASLDAADRAVVRDWLTTPFTLFVSHTDPNQMFPNVNSHLYEIAAANGMTRESLAVVRDRNGREIFQVFRFNPR
jgi:4-amino-4-deoxy-L-arabinose transferase-like glycosyltransferase